jgi:hypothetical protein
MALRQTKARCSSPDDTLPEVSGLRERERGCPNAGLNAATSPYVYVVDADSIFESDALLRIMGPVLEDPKRLVAVGRIIRVLNGSEITGGRAVAQTEYGIQTAFWQDRLSCASLPVAL